MGECNRFRVVALCTTTGGICGVLSLVGEREKILYYIYQLGPTLSHASKAVSFSPAKCMLSRCCRASTRLAVMSQPLRTGSSRYSTVGGPKNYSQPSGLSKLEDLAGGCGARLGATVGVTGSGPQVAGGCTDDPILYDWRTFTANAQLQYIVTEGTANECIARIASRPSPVTIGLDMEWRPTFAPGRPENPIALVQLACDDEILLVQVSAMQGTIYI